MLRILAVDDELPALDTLERAIRKAVPGCQPVCFSSPTKALAWAGENAFDAAFLDVSMGGMNGLILAEKLKELHSRANIIFVTGYSDYMLHAFHMHASGYVTKPVKAEDIAREIAELRHPVSLGEKGIRAKTFGSFELFVDGEPVRFGRSRSKEILAYLIDRRGAGVTRKELAAVLWEDREYSRMTQDYLKKLLAEMMSSLKKAGAGQIIVHKRGFYAVDPTRFDCDYYAYSDDGEGSSARFAGEYMAGYSWAEFTTGWLARRESEKK